MSEYRDFISQLQGCPAIVETILLLLDPFSLSCAEQTCKSWKNAVDDLNIRQKFRRQIERNWRMGSFKKREIELTKVKPFDLSCITMDEQWVVIGLKEFGDILVFSRFDLKPQKNFPQHGKRLEYLKLESEYLTSASNDIFKVFKRETRLLVTEILHPLGCGQQPRVAYGEFLSENGLFVCSNFKKLSVWKLLDNPLRINQLADQLVPESGYCIGKMNMSREHVVLFLHSHQKSISQLHSLVQVRSTLNFDLLYSVDGLGLSSDSRFFCDNKLLVVINGGRLYKVLDLKKKTITEVPSGETGFLSLHGSNGTFAVCYCNLNERMFPYNVQGETIICDVRCALSQNPICDLKNLLVCQIPEIVLKADNFSSLHLWMDNYSILQYSCRQLKFSNGQNSWRKHEFKLIFFDFTLNWANEKQ